MGSPAGPADGQPPAQCSRPGPAPTWPPPQKRGRQPHPHNKIQKLIILSSEILPSSASAPAGHIWVVTPVKLPRSSFSHIYLHCKTYFSSTQEIPPVIKKKISCKSDLQTFFVYISKKKKK